MDVWVHIDQGKKVYGRHMGDAWSGIYHLRRAALGGVQIAALQLWRIHSQMRFVFAFDVFDVGGSCSCVHLRVRNICTRCRLSGT